jgi:uncharacterized membrane protein (UPF0127 family)
MPLSPPLRAAVAFAVAALALGACWGDVSDAGGASSQASVVVHGSEPPGFGTTADTWPSGTATFTDTSGTEHVVSVRIADTAAHRQQGLMGVEEVPAGTGMLFVFDEPHRGGFWMKDTLVPLDIAYVADGEVVAILQMQPCVDYEVATDDCPSYTPDAAYDRAVEVPLGWFAEQDIQPGAHVTVQRR